MLFNSLGFVAFFVLFFLVYWTLVSNRLERQNVWLLLGSLFFYGCWDWRFLGLIGVTILSTYTTAILAEFSHRRLMTTINIVINLAILCTFKYFNFFGFNLARLMLCFGFEVDWVTLDVLLPVGISFYTFQAIGYSIDVYRHNVKAERNLVDFAVFISYFPQLVAGPIESARSLLPQIKRPRQWRRTEIVEGMRQALWGMFKKVVIADACAHHVEKAFAGADHISIFFLVLGTLFFSIQIYCDFSGYCDMARGVSRCLGIDLIQNFRYPYFSRNVQEFWRRWNLSLMTWFRDYVYIPLGGSRRGQLRTYANLFIVFLLSGLWHGASWSFIAWGVYWGVLSVVFRLIDRNTSFKLPASCGILITCWLAVMGWVIFRCNYFMQSFHILQRVALPLAGLALCGVLLIGLYNIVSRYVKRLDTIFQMMFVVAVLAALIARPVDVVHGYIIMYIIVMLIVEWHRRRLDCPLEMLPAGAASGLLRHTWARVTIYWLLILLVLTNYMEEVPFIYFQF